MTQELQLGTGLRVHSCGGKVQFSLVLQGIWENLELNFRFRGGECSNLNLNLEVQVQQHLVQVQEGLN